MKAFIWLLCFVPFLGISQDKMKYSGESIQLIYSDENNKIISEVPLGKPVELYYDAFYKSWQITYYDENKTDNTFKLRYLQTTPDDICIMQDHLESKFMVVNSIGLYGVLFIKPLNAKLNNGLSGYYRINGIKRVN
jgi:hypothetical protein